MVLKQPSLPSAGETKLNDVYKEPIWDVILSYMSVMSFFLSVLTIGGELFFPDLSCFPPTNVSRTQAPFINSWCSNAHLGKVSTLPLALLGQSIALYTPSLLFYHWFFRNIRQFFIEAKELDRHRNSTSGTYSRESLNVVRLLRDQFESSKAMQTWYAVKLIVQGVIALLFVVVLAWLGANSIVEDQFTCPVQIVTEPMWSVEVGCVYPAASTLVLLWAANFFILSVVILFACIGFFWNFCSKTVDYTKTARYHYYYGTTIEPVYKSRCCSVPDDLCLLHRLLFHFDFGIGQSFEELLIILELMDLKRTCYCDILDRKEAVPEHLTTDQNTEISESTRQDTEVQIEGNFSIKSIDISELPSTIARKCYDQYIKKARQKPREISQCLHLCCGDGSCTIALAKYFDEVRGIDFNSGKLIKFDEVAFVGSERNEAFEREQFPEIVEIFHVPYLPTLGEKELPKFMGSIIHSPREPDSPETTDYKYCLVLITLLDQSSSSSDRKKKLVKIVLQRIENQLSPTCIIVSCGLQATAKNIVPSRFSSYLVDDPVIKIKPTESVLNFSYHHHVKLKQS